MDERRFRIDPDTAGTKKRRSRRGDSEHDLHEGVYLAAADAWIPPIFGVDRPLVGALLAEDTCWCFARDDWRERRPAFWRRAPRRAWRDEGRQLEDKRTRLVEQAAELRLVRAPGTGSSRAGK